MKDVILTGRIKPLEECQKGKVKCGKSRCQVCRLVDEGDGFMDSWGEKSYVINDLSDCDYSRIVYLTKCQKCLKQHGVSCVKL